MREPEVVRDLYAAAAEEWVARGRDAHYALVPATDPELVDAWFRLSFGAQHAAAIQETPDSIGQPHLRMSSSAARSRKTSTRRRRSISSCHVTRTARRSFRAMPAPTGITDEDRAEFLSDVDDAEIGLFVAEIDGKPVGELLMVPVERSSMHVGLARPERAAFLGFAATLPEARGSGAGLALTNAGLAWAREHDYPVTVVDWRETNLLASRFWPARGFRRTFLRLYRSIP